MRDGMLRRNTLTQCRMASVSAGTVGDRSGGVTTETDGFSLNLPDTVSALWGYDNDTPEVVRLGVNLSGREVECLADLFLAAEEVALEAEGAAPKTFSVNSRREEEWSIATLCRRPEGKTTT